MELRKKRIERKTAETSIVADLVLDGRGRVSVRTGIGMLDHLLSTLSYHARFDLELECRGDLHVDDHHTAEDCALVLGRAIDGALGDRTGIARFGSAYAPLDEALCRCVVDLGGRPWAEVELGLAGPCLGGLAAQNATHFFTTLAMQSRMCLHLDVLRGANDHHRAEAASKALALALRQAASITGGGLPSTKGVLG
ncbi:MAG: imidazoleglycerol-phosphate dehydratase HisB [Deltaproteobacteria bacterium]|nr:MAG: imidazoleglycerol-phosphate dehydratase HisB [Deltaproteobacteria bacterium]